MENVIAGIFSGTAAIVTAASWFAYRYAFYSANHQQDIYAVPAGEQYQKDKSKMMPLTRLFFMLQGMVCLVCWSI